MASYNQIEKAVAGLFQDIRFTHEPRGLYDPLRYMIEIGGKRLRPALCLTAYSLYKEGFSEEVLQCAAALEVFHSFTFLFVFSSLQYSICRFLSLDRQRKTAVR